jgi:hypothetical protein
MEDVVGEVVGLMLEGIILLARGEICVGWGGWFLEWSGFVSESEGAEGVLRGAARGAWLVGGAVPLCVNSHGGKISKWMGKVQWGGGQSAGLR